MFTLPSFFINHKKLVIIILVIVALSPLWVNWIIILGNFIYFDMTYPDWDNACSHHIILERYDESAFEIASNAIKEKYPDMNIPETAVYVESTNMYVNSIISESHTKWSVIIDALNENGIGAKYGSEECA